MLLKYSCWFEREPALTSALHFLGCQSREALFRGVWSNWKNMVTGQYLPSLTSRWRFMSRLCFNNNHIGLQKSGGLCIAESLAVFAWPHAEKKSSPVEGKPTVVSLAISSVKVNSWCFWTLVNPLSKMYSGNLDRLPLFRAFAGITKPISMAVINITISERIWVIALMWGWARAWSHLYSSHKGQQSYHFVMKIGTCSWKKPRYKFERTFSIRTDSPHLLWKYI